jgi:hypothetical protein
LIEIEEGILRRYANRSCLGPLRSHDRRWNREGSRARQESVFSAQSRGTRWNCRQARNAKSIWKENKNGRANGNFDPTSPASQGDSPPLSRHTFLVFFGSLKKSETLGGRRPAHTRPPALRLRAFGLRVRVLGIQRMCHPGKNLMPLRLSSSLRWGIVPLLTPRPGA